MFVKVLEKRREKILECYQKKNMASETRKCAALGIVSVGAT